MKPYAATLKSIAALLMLLALLALLLPCTRITSNGHQAEVSGMDVITTGARLAQKHHEEGAIPANYPIKGDLTWGDLTGGVATLQSHGQLRNAEIGLALLLMPAVLCFFAMIFTFIAIGKKTMFLPTILLIGSVVESFFIGIGLTEIISSIIQYGNSQGMKTTTPFTVSLIIGCKLFMFLTVIALVIILFLWLVGGFNRPDKEDRRSRNREEEDEDSSNGRKKRRGRKKRGRKKKKTKKEKQKQKQDDNKEQQAKQMAVTGNIEGISGFYLSVSKDLANTQGNRIVLGTTKQAMQELQEGSMKNYKDMAMHNVVISYDDYAEDYQITSHADGEVRIIESSGGKGKVLQKGQSVRVVSGTILSTVAGDAAMILH